MKNFLLLFLLIPAWAHAQREASVHGKYVYIVSDNDHITLREAKQNCVERARVEAVKQEFGELLISDIVDSSVESNGSSAGSYFWENTAAMAKGEWLGDTKAPKIEVEYKDGDLVFSAEVWGMAREIVQSKVDLDLNILKDVNGTMTNASLFESGENIYLRFRSPSSGYLAVYLTVGSGKTYCLLPYMKDEDGRFPVRAGMDYLLFSKETDRMAQLYRLTTSHRQEANQLVIIYSPNPFTKCNDKSGDPRRPNVLNTVVFEKWLLNCRHSDSEMVVDKRWLKIHNVNIEE